MCTYIIIINYSVCMYVSMYVCMYVCMYVLWIFHMCYTTPYQITPFLMPRKKNRYCTPTSSVYHHVSHKIASLGPPLQTSHINPYDLGDTFPIIFPSFSHQSWKRGALGFPKRWQWNRPLQPDANEGVPALAVRDPLMAF